MTRKILTVRLTQPVISQLDSLAQEIGYSKVETGRLISVTGCDQERLPPGYWELAEAKQAKASGRLSAQ